MDRLKDLLCDINANEINSQIESNNLENWLSIWHSEVDMALVEINEARVRNILCPIQHLIDAWACGKIAKLEVLEKIESYITMML